MADRKGVTHDAADPDLDRQIRDHFAAMRQSSPVPGFESVMAKAEASEAVAASGRRPAWLADLIDGWSAQARWVGGAAAAAFVAALTLFITLQTADDQAAKERAAAEVQLLASLERTTRWQAPSDRWLAVETDIDIFGLPEIGSPEVLKEKSTWL